MSQAFFFFLLLWKPHFLWKFCVPVLYAHDSFVWKQRECTAISRDRWAWLENRRLADLSCTSGCCSQTWSSVPLEPRTSLPTGWAAAGPPTESGRSPGAGEPGVLGAARGGPAGPGSLGPAAWARPPTPAREQGRGSAPGVGHLPGDSRGQAGTWARGWARRGHQALSWCMTWHVPTGPVRCGPQAQVHTPWPNPCLACIICAQPVKQPSKNDFLCEHFFSWGSEPDTSILLPVT